MKKIAIAVLGSFLIAGGVSLVGCGGGQPKPLSGKDVGESREAAPIPERGSPAGLSVEPGTAKTEAAGSPAPATESSGEFREVTLPAGTSLAIVLDTAVASDQSRAEEPITGHLADSVAADGVTALPAGSTVSGVVVSAVQSGKVKGRAQLSLRFDAVSPKGNDARYAFVATPVSRTAASTRKKDAAEIGLPAIGGAVIGGLVGGKKGAVIGGAAGGGAGTAVVLSTRGEEVRLARGTTLRVRLEKPLTVRVPRA